MRVVLVNPNWSFEGSVYFGCQEPHLPLELGYSAALLQRHGHEASIIDGHLWNLSAEAIRARAEAFRPDMVVVTTAPSYLFWRCPPPELRVPRETVRTLRGVGGFSVAIGPHGSVTPGAVLRKLGVDAVVLGEPEEVLPLFSNPDWRAIPSVAYPARGGVRVQGPRASASLSDLPALEWPTGWIARHPHHHHRFDSPPRGAGAEMESSRGCPYRCTFCALENFRGQYRRRPLPVVLKELDLLLAQGAEYVYFIDEIFLPDRPLLEALSERPVSFGIQTRIDLWTPKMLELLGRAGCRSIEAGVESLSEEGRRRLGKPGSLTTAGIAERLVEAKRHVPFVQANLVAAGDDPEAVSVWREKLLRKGVWANDPVPLFPYPGSEDYRRLFGTPDEEAWERAHSWYLERFGRLSELQSAVPLRLEILESGGIHA